MGTGAVMIGHQSAKNFKYAKFLAESAKFVKPL